MRVASGIGMGTTIKHLRCTTSGAAGNGLGATMKYLRRTTSVAANNGLSTTITPPCSAASFEVNSEPHTGARPSVRLCVGPELARCVHSVYTVHFSKKWSKILLTSRKHETKNGAFKTKSFYFSTLRPKQLAILFQHGASFDSGDAE
jgi:hypothetical protein